MPDHNPEVNHPTYPGPSREYKPDLGEVRAGPPTSARRSQGYHDEALLRRNLESIKIRCNALIEASEKRLRRGYTLGIDEGTKLQEAQDIEWPSSLRGDNGEIPAAQYVTYDQYRVMRAKPTRGADYIMRAYEDNVRGAAGTNALDIIHGVEPIKAEAETIEAFLDKYLGDVNDSAEYRTLELLQDWTFNALTVTGRFRDRFKSEATSASQIPSAEMARISQEEAKHFQTLWKIKLNVANNEIAQILKDFDKDYTKMSEVYFDRFLGPALDFRLKTGRSLEMKQGKDSFLGSEAMSAVTALNVSFEGTLADQLRRNTVFSQKMDALFERLAARDNYVSMIKQMEVRGGAIRNPFTNVAVKTQETAAFTSELQTIQETKATRNVFKSSHLNLDDADNPDTHPWAINRWGDVIYGEITFDVDSATPALTTNVGPDGEALPFDGMRPGGPTSHMHRGVDVDGTRQIHGGESIEYETLITPTINSAEFVPTPINLRLLDEDVCIDTGDPIVNAKIAWDCDPDQEYEVQVVPYCTPLPPDDCLRGHPFDYPLVPCEPWATERIFLEAGHDTGYTEDNEILLPDGVITNDVTCAITIPISDEYFVAAYDSNIAIDTDVPGTNLDLALCRRELLTLEWTIVETITIATNSSSTQKYICGVQVSDTDVLIGCMNGNVPSLVLVRVNTDTEALSVIDSLPVINTAVTPIDEYWGINSIDTYEDGSRFVIGYPFKVDDPTATYTSFAYVNVGSLTIPAGGSTRDTIELAPHNAQAMSSGYSDSLNICVRMITDNLGVVSWDETDDDLDEPFSRGYWSKAFTTSESLFTGFSELQKIVEFPSGSPVIETLEHNKYVVLSSQEAFYYPNPGFTDVPTTHPFYDDIAWMAYEGITTGFEEDNTFRPAQAMTRQASAAFLYRIWVGAGEDGDDPDPFPDPGFSDVPPSHQFYTEISWMAYYDISNGYEDGTFRPAEEVTRQAFAAFVHRFWLATGRTEPDSVPNPGFSDVPESNPFYDDIAWMAYMEITTGYSDGTYRPTEEVTRQAASAFLHRLWVAMGLEPEESECIGVINPKVLKAEIFQVDNLVISNPFDETHVVDAALNTNDAAMWMSKWRDDQLLVVWGSNFDEPNNEVTSRAKAAILVYDDQEPDGFMQETWDLPINLPAQPPYSAMTPTRMGNTTYFIISGAGGEEYGPTRYNPEDDTLYPTKIDGINYLDIPDDDTGHVLPTGQDGFNSGSALLLDDGRVIYAFVDGDDINIGYAPDLETFITEDESVEDIVTVFPSLDRPTCTLFRDPSDDNYIYMVWNCFGQDPAEELFGGANGVTALFPWQFIFRSDDDGETWDEYSIIESPLLAGENFSWDNNAGYNTFGSEYPTTIVSQPYIDGDMWILSAPNFRREGSGASALKNPRPAIWKSVDGGLNWSLKFDQEGHYPGEAYNGSGSRNIVFYEDILWWMADDEKVVVLSTAFYVSTDATGETWSEGAHSIYDNDPFWVPSTGAFFVAPFDNVDSLYVARPEGIVAAYPNEVNGVPLELPIDLDEPEDFEPFNRPGVLQDTAYQEVYTNDTTGDGSVPDIIVQELGDYYVIMHNGYVTAMENIDTRFHKGAVAFIVDQCSDPRGPRI